LPALPRLCAASHQDSAPRHPGLAALSCKKGGPQPQPFRSLAGSAAAPARG